MKFPAFYSGALAFSCDAEYLDFDRFCRLGRFFGGDLGLEYAGSIFWHLRSTPTTFSYFQSDSVTQKALREMIREGHIDTCHAYGDFDDGGFTQIHARRIVEECLTYDLKLPVWTNHGNDRNFQNIGHARLQQYQRGDDPFSVQYHLPFARQIGCKYFWVDNGLTPVLGGGPLLYGEIARDGSPLLLFRRFRGLVGKPAPTCSSLEDQITLQDVEDLCDTGSAAVLYQHFGCDRKMSDGYVRPSEPPFFSSAGIRLLDSIANLYHSGRLWVTTTSNLLQWVHTGKTTERLLPFRW